MVDHVKPSYGDWIYLPDYQYPVRLQSGTCSEGNFVMMRCVVTDRIVYGKYEDLLLWPLYGDVVAFSLSLAGESDQIEEYVGTVTLSRFHTEDFVNVIVNDSKHFELPISTVRVIERSLSK